MMAVENSLFSNAVAPRNNAPQLHSLGASWTKGTMIGARDHSPIMHDSLASLCDIRHGFNVNRRHCRWLGLPAQLPGIAIHH